MIGSCTWISWIKYPLVHSVPSNRWTAAPLVATIPSNILYRHIFANLEGPGACIYIGGGSTITSRTPRKKITTEVLAFT
jgi:hypothetical protein